MPRPNSITNEQILRWSNNLDNDPNMQSEWLEDAIMREVCYAGQWLQEELQKLGCDEVMIVRIMYTAANLSFGRDMWEIHQRMLADYINGDLEFEIDYDSAN